MFKCRNSLSTFQDKSLFINSLKIHFLFSSLRIQNSKFRISSRSSLVPRYSSLISQKDNRHLLSSLLSQIIVTKQTPAQSRFLHTQKVVPSLRPSAKLSLSICSGKTLAVSSLCWYSCLFVSFSLLHFLLSKTDLSFS